MILKGTLVSSLIIEIHKIKDDTDFLELVRTRAFLPLGWSVFRDQNRPADPHVTGQNRRAD
jgi:hypothetical protein